MKPYFRKASSHILALILITTCGLGIASPYIGKSKQAEELSKEVLRLHILANSDGNADQKLKLEIRDFIVSEYESQFNSFESKEESIEYFESRLDEVKEKVDYYLASSGASYASQIQLSKTSFPDREYCGVLYPQGEYDAMRILLGEARGANWWCVLYPPLCFANVQIDPNPQPAVVSKDKIEVRWKFLGILNSKKENAGQTD
ncbi:MAG: stage II sporulation protein R [Eubacteriaceae bacterium]|nr:stage II sporulation protein R [Eubacteriaceae bacterium]